MPVMAAIYSASFDEDATPGIESKNNLNTRSENEPSSFQKQGFGLPGLRLKKDSKVLSS